MTAHYDLPHDRRTPPRQHPLADWRKYWRGEATIILPDAAGDAAHVALADALVRAFGGLTITDCSGAWRDAADTVHVERGRVYTVAVPSLALPHDASGIVNHGAERLWLAAEGALRTIARDAAVAGQQECVYLRAPDGRVWFVKPDGLDYDGYVHGGYDLAPGIDHARGR